MLCHSIVLTTCTVQNNVTVLFTASIYIMLCVCVIIRCIILLSLRPVLYIWQKKAEQEKTKVNEISVKWMHILYGM